jgi:hypothetical protein
MTSNLYELFQTIHLALSAVIDTTNFYIALYDGTKAERITQLAESCLIIPACTPSDNLAGAVSPTLSTIC